MPIPTNLKKARTAAVLLCGAVLAVLPAMAQNDAPPPPPQDGQQQGPPPHGPGGPRGMNPERRLEMLQKQLNLSADQAAQIKQIFADSRAKMEALRGDSSAQEDRRAKMMSLHMEEDGKIHGVLTAEQKTKYDAMAAHMRERREEHRGDDGGVPPPPPPQQ